MKLIKSFTIIILLLSTEISAQFTPGARQISLANSDVALADDAFALFNNPAGISQLDWNEVGIYYSPAPFGLKELANGFASYIHPTKIGNFAVGYMTYGFELYRENKFTLSYSRNIFNKYFLGISIDYNHLYIKNYGDDNPITFNLGVLAYILDDLRAGFSVFNLTKSTYGKEKGQIPTIYNFGISYDFDKNLILNLSAIKESDRKLSTRFGLEYLIIKYLFLRAGVYNNPSTFTGGIGINYSIFSIDYAISSHQDLGLTHQVGLIVHFKEYESRSESKKRFLGIINN